MEERYPYIRFVIGAARFLGGAVALILFLGGTSAACERGGVGGFFSFVIAVIIAGIGYVGVMVWVESLRVFLDIEDNTRQILTAERSPHPPVAPAASPAAPPTDASAGV